MMVGDSGVEHDKSAVQGHPGIKGYELSQVGNCTGVSRETFSLWLVDVHIATVYVEMETVIHTESFQRPSLNFKDFLQHFNESPLFLVF